jgi:gliding motility-associated protein GldM
MASGKQSPRQKMINMMYLVLLALLAMNVSKEILKAFHLMEQSFLTSQKNIDEKNGIIENVLIQSNKENPTRTKEWLDRAQEVRRISKSFCTQIDSIKSKIINQAGGYKPDPEADPDALLELQQSDNMEKHANFFESGSGKQGQGEVLQSLINKTREDLLDQLNHEKTKNFIDDLRRQTALKAEDPKSKGTSKPTWYGTYLVHSPLAGVTAILTKIQNDCKNLESDILNILSQQTTASLIKFDKVSSQVITEKSYVMIGESFQADVVLMALNTTSSPVIKLFDGTVVPVQNGIGKLTIPARSAGIQTVQGYVTVEDPNSSSGFRNDTFRYEWQAAPPSATISALSMNVLYVGLDNPIRVSVPGYPASDVTVSISNGSLVKKPGTQDEFIATVKPVQGNKTLVVASVRMKDGSVRKMGEQEYRIKRVPSPEPRYGTLAGGEHPRAVVMRQANMIASLGAEFVFDGVQFTVTKFKALLVTRSAPPRPFTGNGSSLAQINAALSSARPGDQLIVSNIEVKGPDGTRPLTTGIIIDLQ